MKYVKCNVTKLKELNDKIDYKSDWKGIYIRVP